MFRKKQKFNLTGGAVIIEKRPQTTENGFVEYVDFRTDVKLPDPSMTDLGLLLKAGVPLQEVNSVILDGRKTFDVDTLKNEVNDEN